MPDRRPEKFDPIRVFCAVALVLLMVFVFCLIVGCAAEAPRAPIPYPFLNWQFLDQPGLPRKACLSEEDTAKLREYEIQCSEVSAP